MSAIWGCVDMSGKALPEGLCAAMELPLHEYRVDRFSTLQEGSVALGCGVQYITRESPREALPVNEGGVYFTADCILDNREELLAQLSPQTPELPDGGLLLLAYKAWGEQTPEHVRGMFAFAVYENGELTLCTDHVSSRCLHYCRMGDIVYFGTLIESICAGLPQRPEISREYLGGYLASRTVAAEVDPDSTPYEGVKTILPATLKIFSSGGGERGRTYWDAKSVKPLRLKSNEEYKAHIEAVLEQAARELLRTQGEVSILLSSGMDSSTVASFCAPILAQQGKKLYSFTSVPIESYNNTDEPWLRTDESKEVLEFCGMYPNIEPAFSAFPEQNGFMAAKKIVPCYEKPVKTTPNALWINGFMEQAREKGCRVMLTGQFGNSSISLGSMEMYVSTMLRRLRFFSAYHAMSAFAQRLKYSRKRVFRVALGENMPLAFRRRKEKNFLSESIISRELAESLGISERDPRFAGNTEVFPQRTFKLMRGFMNNVSQFALLGVHETKSGLAHGMVSRDLTRHIKVLELCLSLPLECFANREGESRILVRNYLSERFPPEMHRERAPKGQQAADWKERLLPIWPRLHEELSQALLGETLRPYVDREKLEALLSRVRETPMVENRYDMIQVLSLYSLLMFLCDDAEKRTKDKA